MDARSPGGDGAPDPDPEQAHDDATEWRCARCGTPVTREEALIAVGGHPARARYPNPAGVVWEVVTVGYAQNLRPVGAPTDAFTWFPGYSWRIVGCGGCGTHLGWRYDATGALPATFWGLILPRLRVT